MCGECVEWDDRAVTDLDEMDRLGSYIPSHARRHSVVELHSHIRSHRRIPAALGTEGLRPAILGLRQGPICRIRSQRGWGRGAKGWEGMVQEETGRDGTGWDGMGWDGMAGDGMG